MYIPIIPAFTQLSQLPTAHETELETTAKLPSDGYEQPQPQVQPSVQEQPQMQEPSVETPQPEATTPTHSHLMTSHLTPDQAPTQPIMAQCPLCQQQIMEFINPCLHCGGELEWG